MRLAAAILAEIDLDPDPLRARRQLEGRCESAVARAAVELAELRRRALGKFSDPSHMLLTRKGLEQATDLRVARWRAQELGRLVGPATGNAQIWDSTAGLGAESLALLSQGWPVTACELDPLHAACCASNLEFGERSAPGGAHAGVHAVDAMEYASGRPDLEVGAAAPAGPRFVAMLLDPDRRADESSSSRGRPGGGRRRLDPEAFAPAVASWPGLLEQAGGACIKLPPGLDPAELADLVADRPHRWTWVEAGGELRELSLWTGTLAPPREPRRAAVRLLGEASGELAAARLAAHAGRMPAPACLDADPTWLFEPRPSAIRAGLIPQLARDLGLSLLDPEVAYLGSTAEQPVASPFLRSWQVLAASALDRKRVRRMLGAAGVTAVSVKKRGHPKSAESLARDLGLTTRGASPEIALVVSPSPAGYRALLVRALPEQT